MASRVLFVVYDNGAYDQIFPMGVGALTAILKKQGHEITIWHQDIHHYPDEYLTQYRSRDCFMRVWDEIFLDALHLKERLNSY